MLGRSLLGRLRRRLLLRRLLRLHLGLLGLRRALLARLVLAAAAAAAMPLRRRLTIVRRGPHFRLGLGWFCRHACTSWNVTLEFIGFWGSATLKKLRFSAFLAFPVPVRTRKFGSAGEIKAGRSRLANAGTSKHLAANSRHPRSEPIPSALRRDSHIPSPAQCMNRTLNPEKLLAANQAAPVHLLRPCNSNSVKTAVAAIYTGALHGSIRWSGSIRRGRAFLR